MAQRERKLRRRPPTGHTWSGAAVAPCADTDSALRGADSVAAMSNLGVPPPGCAGSSGMKKNDVKFPWVHAKLCVSISQFLHRWRNCCRCHLYDFASLRGS